MFSKSTCCNCSKNNGEKRREKWEGKRERERRLNTKILMACNLIQILQNVERWLIRWINRICAAMAGFLLEFWSKFRSLTESADVSLPPGLIFCGCFLGGPCHFPFYTPFARTAGDHSSVTVRMIDIDWSPGKQTVWFDFLFPYFFRFCCFL